MEKKTLTARVDHQVWERLKVVAEKDDRTMHYVLKKAILHYLDHLEKGESQNAQN